MRITRKTLVTAPALEPLALNETKDFINVSGSDDDTLISNLIKAARQYVEQNYNVAMITSTWDFTMERFPQWKHTEDPHSLIEPMILPVQSITSITYYDANNDLQTLSASAYEAQLDNDRFPAIWRAYEQLWPETYVRRDAVKIRLVAGYGATAASVPEPVRVALLMFVKFLFDNREDMPINKNIVPYPRAVEMLLRNFYYNDI
jgi:uncharacterized phiE125 gp8 family phage protein